MAHPWGARLPGGRRLEGRPSAPNMQAHPERTPRRRGGGCSSWPRASIPQTTSNGAARDPNVTGPPHSTCPMGTHGSRPPMSRQQTEVVRCCPRPRAGAAARLVGGRAETGQRPPLPPGLPHRKVARARQSRPMAWRRLRVVQPRASRGPAVVEPEAHSRGEPAHTRSEGAAWSEAARRCGHTVEPHAVSTGMRAP